MRSTHTVRRTGIKGRYHHGQRGTIETQRSLPYQRIISWVSFHYEKKIQYSINRCSNKQYKGTCSKNTLCLKKSFRSFKYRISWPSLSDKGRGGTFQRRGFGGIVRQGGRV